MICPIMSKPVITGEQEIANSPSIITSDIHIIKCAKGECALWNKPEKACAIKVISMKMVKAEEV